MEYRGITNEVQSYKKISSELRKEVYLRDRNICQECEEQVVFTRDIRNTEDYKKEASLDHIIPRSKGGKDVLNNLRTICRSCNSRKKDREDEDELKFLNLNKGEWAKVHNCILTALARTKLNGEESRIVFAILYKTYGFNKSEDWIANSQLEQLTGIHRTHCSRSVHKLMKRNIVTKTGNIIKLNKYFFQWDNLLPKLATLPKQANSVTKTGIYPLPKLATTKDNIQYTTLKEDLEKKDFKKIRKHLEETGVLKPKSYITS